MNKNKVGVRNWFIFIIVGIVGQLAWSLENMYLNSYIFSFGDPNYQKYISITVAASAITACLTTLIMGGLTDKVGRRKVFIVGGYILWGLSTAAFGLLNDSNFVALFPIFNGAMIGSIMVIVLDCVMTFFGSTANDAAFNSYLTKHVDDNNRGKVEGVVSILPLMSMLLITVLYGMFVNETSKQWNYFFYIIGGFVFVAGIVALFLIPKEKVDKSNEKYFSILLEGFKFKVIKKNPLLYIVLICDFIYCMASQIVFPYMMIYFNNTLGIVGGEFTIFMAVVLLAGSALTVLSGFVMDKVNKSKSLIVWSLIYIIGLVLLFFVNNQNTSFYIFTGCAVIFMFGYIVMSACINALVRDNIPEGKEGTFQGIRLIFQVALPMVTGPFIGEFLVNQFSTATYVNEFGVTQNLPSAIMWIVAAGAMVLIFIPNIILIVKQKKLNKNKNQGIIYEQED